MNHNFKNIHNESASFNVPKNQKKEKGEYEDFILKLMGRIFLTKKVFFGFEENKIAIVVTPTLKIAMILSSPKKLLSTFPFERNDSLDTYKLREWAKSNGYEITFSTPLPRLKLKLRSEFGDVMITESKTVNNDNSILFEEVKKSNLPDPIKQWVIDNPEKFKQNIEEIKKLLNN